MQYTMKLAPEPFRAVQAGYKSIELRLNDEKRQALRPGDTIVFSNTEDPAQTVTKEVAALHVFSDFAALYRKLPLLRCGYTPFTLPKASPADMEAYYPPEEQKRSGVVGIELREEPLQRYLAGHTGAMWLCADYETALREIRAGQKTTHWIWYILPQLHGLTGDTVTEYYGLRGRREAQAFLDHPLLGARLREMAEALLTLGQEDPVVIFGKTDAYKLRACMTLFDALSPEDVFDAVLERYCLGGRDADTLAIL